MSTPITPALNDSFNWFILIFYKNAYSRFRQFSFFIRTPTLGARLVKILKLQKIKKHFGSSRASQLWYMMGI